MAKTLLYISIFLTLVTAGVSFLTKTKIDALNTDLSARRTEVAQLKGTVAKQVADLKKAADDLTAANKTIDDQKGQLQVAVNDLSAAKGDLEKTKASLMESETKLADVTMKFDADEEKLKSMTNSGIDPAKVAEIQANYEKAKTELAESRQVQDTLKTRAKDFEEKNGVMAKELERYIKGTQKPGITGRIVAVNSGWNFCVIDVGDKRGATLGAQLIVSRGGQTVGRLRVTSVEPSSCIADVVPGSVARGTSVQLGDTVIFAGRSNVGPGPVEGAAPAGGATPPSGISSTTPLPN